MEKINIAQKFGLFDEQWTPKIIASLNGQDVKLARLEGEFVWHSHDLEDELFYVVKGELILEMHDNTVILKAGEMFVVPRGVEHKPIAEKEVLVMLFEPSDIKHTGNVQHELTKEKSERI